MNCNKLIKNLIVGGILIFSGIFIISCQTLTPYTYEGMVAPKVIVPPDVKTMAFVDRNISFKQDTNTMYYKYDDIVWKDTVNYDPLIFKYCYSGFSENLSEFFALDTLPFYRLKKEMKSGIRKYQPLSWETVDSICRINNSDVLVCLEDVLIYNEYEIIEDVVDVGNVGITDIKYFVIWRIYDPLTQTYTDERVVNDSLFTEVDAYSKRLLIQEKMPKRAEVMRDVSYEIGRQYAKYLSPKWITISRKYFSTGDQRLTVAEYYLQNDQLDKAIQLWREVAESEKSKIAARACYNLAFALEIKGEYKEANHWIRKSVKKYKELKSLPPEFKQVKEYTTELILRTQNYYRLNKFFGEEVNGKN
jgi:tetratricopeptide (TPR) repeat protein